MKLKTFILLALGVLSTTWAQNPKWKDKIKTMKIAYITEHLELTPQQAEKFWPIYNKHDERIFELRHKEMRGIKMKFNKPIDEISESEAQAMLDEFIDLENELLNEHKQMNADLKKILSAKKILLLKKVEDDFNRELLRKIGKRRGGPH
ncbi:hypothetical protein NBRC110019_13310 [Neptunitalea chrysea]|uniref:Sensor of ECF-type sigma factor n=1 Tax=Neptunitalea chrysea TaxID=1647581 RepID=A0A9W6B5M0_9FLAO|nr:sensor of ECF-type sigma factor [Neptunitalea chrysea]GLB52292.1 hypothetical protein NBRC110019_13310 [Neptunitalea chrysea]